MDMDRLASITRVVWIVSRCFGTSGAEIRRGRTKAARFHRMICMYLIRRHTRCGIHEIAAYFGGRSQVGVLAQIRILSRHMGKDVAMRNLLSQLGQIVDGFSRAGVW
jgi:chromosomal replication initiation ATPase DnaA